MITRKRGYLQILPADGAPPETAQLERDGFAVVKGLLNPAEVDELSEVLLHLYGELPPDQRNSRIAGGHAEPFRYETLNRSALAQRTLAHPRLLSIIEPLLGEDCHVIANTTWRQLPEETAHGGRFWHLDAGPHIPRPEGVPWDHRIPYPIFAIAAQILLMDCPLAAGPTGVIPGSHRSGQAPPADRRDDETLTWNGVSPVVLEAKAGDVQMFVSDIWHRRMPSHAGDPGRFFLQIHYGRRDIAQRIRGTAIVNHLSPEAIARAVEPRERTIVGLHGLGFYDG